MNILSRLTGLLPQSRSIRSTSLLAGGTALAQGIALFASPLLTRIYTPSDFGVLATYTAILAIVTVVAGLRYELAIPLPRTHGAAANVLVLSCFCVLGLTAATSVLLILFGRQLVTWTNTSVLAPYLWLISIGVALGGFYQCFNYWALRKSAFKRIASTRLQQSLSGVAAQVIAGLIGLGPLGLIVGQIIGQAIALLELVRRTLLEDHRTFARISRTRIGLVAKRYRDFPFYSTLEGLTNAASIQIPVLLLAASFLSADVGLFLLALRVLQTPLGVVGSAVGQVFFSRATVARRSGALDELTLKAFRSLVHIGVGPMLGLAIVAPDLFAFTFGEQWRASGEYVRWMAPWLIMQFIFSPISVLTVVSERQRDGFRSQLLFLCIRIGFLLAGISTGSVAVAIAAYSISGAIVYLAYGAWLMRLARVSTIAWSVLLFRSLFSYAFIFGAVLYFAGAWAPRL